MASDWKAPEDWQKDGSIISGVTSLKTGAWTSMLSAKENRNGKEVDVVIKTFSVPVDVFQDPDRITREREKFLASARLQKQLSDANAAAWVPVLRISEDPNNTSFSMPKTGESLQNLIDRKTVLPAKDLHEITMSVLQGFEEIMQRQKRSHGSLKPSDVLCAPGHNPPYRLADPAPKGEAHPANDLYALGLLLFELIEHKEWDPLTPIIPTSKWARFKGKREKWINFLNMLLSPNGCQESLAAVRKEAQRLKPSSPVKALAITGTLLLMFSCVLTGGAFLAWPYVKDRLVQHGPVAGGGGGGTNVPPVTIDPQVKADWEKAHDAYLSVRTKWTSREVTRSYDHTKSTDIVRSANALVKDIPLTDTASYKTSLEGYKAATAKYEEALTVYADETRIGESQDADALASFQKAQDAYNKVRTDWDKAAAAFDPTHNHKDSQAFAQATPTPPSTAPADANGRHAAADQLMAAAARYQQALEMAKKEEIASKTDAQAKADFQTAKTKLQTARDQWDAAAAGLTFDISSAKRIADAARGAVPTELELTDVASYQKATDAYAAAAGKYQEALITLEKLKRERNVQDTDPAAAMAQGKDALSKKDFTSALAWFRKAADLGNAEAMYNLGLLYETGRGTDKNSGEAAKWYQKAADMNQPGAMVNLGLLYERGVGVDKDVRRALTLYSKASELKNTDGMRNMAYLFDNGIGVDKDAAEALKWYQRAADLNDAAAMYCVGRAYEQGRGTRVDMDQAKAWYTKGASANNARSMSALGDMYYAGRGVAQNYASAMEWYKKAGQLNFAPAIYNVGDMYENAIGVALNHQEAMTWLKRAADLGLGRAMYAVGALYETGRGTDKNLNEALVWYRKAAASDDPEAVKLATDRLGQLGFRP